MTTFFTRAEFERAPKTLLRDGRIANAKVYRLQLAGKDWTVKDFSERPWYIRETIGHALISHEVRMINRLKGLDGVSQHAFQIDRFAMAVEFMPGTSIQHFGNHELTPEFLEAFEALIRRMHEQHVVHLDCRGLGNVLVRPDGTPGLIDFQSALYTRYMPTCLREYLEDIDNSAPLKRWQLGHPNLMGEERKEKLSRIEQLRRWWPFEGYFGKKKSPENDTKDES